MGLCCLHVGNKAHLLIAAYYLVLSQHFAVFAWSSHRAHGNVDKPRQHGDIVNQHVDGLVGTGLSDLLGTIKPRDSSDLIYTGEANREEEAGRGDFDRLRVERALTDSLRDVRLAVDTGISPDKLVVLTVGVPVSTVNHTMLAKLKSLLASAVGIPEDHVRIYKIQYSDNTIDLYFIRNGFTSQKSPHALIPASEILSFVSLNSLQKSLPQLQIKSIKRENELIIDSYHDAFWTQPYFPYIAAACAMVVCASLIVMIVCCMKKRPKSEAADRALPPQQICLFPVAKPHLNHATMVQPDFSAVYSDRLSDRFSSGTPTPVQTPPMRIKARGLLERRGSNASLTIDLTPAAESPAWGSPPRECSAEEYLLSAGNRMSRKELRQCVKNPKALHEEFWEVPMNHPDHVEVAGSGMKNRYRTIVPNEHTRVELPDIDGDPLSSYINANYIKGYAGEPRAYIATQGPMSHTINDFWRMVWFEDSPIIVMITKLKEKEKVKCESYLPDICGKYGDIDVLVTDITECGGYTLRHVTLKCGQQQKSVLHYWYTAWPDHKAPEAAKPLLQLVKEVERQRLLCVEDENRSKGATVVHCSAGIGRTGCFIATTVGIRQLQEERMVDVLGILCNMRYDRGGMIQTNEQYEFVHHALCLFEKELPESRRSSGFQ